MEYSWAEQYPELYKVITLFQLSEVANPIKYSYKSIEAISQEGPQCGLVALAMCTGVNGKDNLKTIFESAKHQHFTHNGEIFSVHYMHSLANEFLKPCKIQIFEGDLNCNKIEEFLLNGGLILVPYPLL